MDAGAKVEAGFDLALTELIEEGRDLFVMEAGSAAGVDLIKDLPHRPATAEEIAAADRVVDRTRSQMGQRVSRWDSCFTLDFSISMAALCGARHARATANG
jgi:sulfhydrogenase subunit beta (sulfur reductase)